MPTEPYSDDHLGIDKPMTPDKVSSVSEEMVEAGYIQACSYPAIALHASHNETRSMVRTVLEAALRSSAPRTSEDAEWRVVFTRKLPLYGEARRAARDQALIEFVEGMIANGEIRTLEDGNGTFEIYRPGIADTLEGSDDS